MAWYRVGTATVTNGSPNVTGTGTAWNANARQGYGFRGPDGKVYEVLNVTGDGALTLAENYTGTSTTGSYAIVPTQGLTADLVTQVQALLGAVQTMLTSGAGVGRFGDGTAGAPGVSFAADPDTGLIRAAANIVAIVTGGTVRLQIGSSGHATPGADNVQELGSSGLRWQTVYARALRDGSGGTLVDSAGTAARIAAGADWTELLLCSNGGVRAKFDAAGNYVQTLQSAVPALADNAQFVITRVSDTQVRLSMRGNDGTTRSAPINLT